MNKYHSVGCRVKPQHHREVIKWAKVHIDIEFVVCALF